MTVVSILVLTFFKCLCECETEAAKYAYSCLKVILKRCLSMYFLVPSAHLAFITAPMTQTWLCSIPAPHQYSVGEQSNDYCCRSPRTPGNMAAGSLCSKLEIASRGPDTFLYFSEEKKKTKREASGQTFIPLWGYVSRNTDLCSLPVMTNTWLID